jgi:hypothetical protein
LVTTETSNEKENRKKADISLIRSLTAKQKKKKKSFLISLFFITRFLIENFPSKILLFLTCRRRLEEGKRTKKQKFLPN